eukprot:1175592-Prorocentrum_minimum.AAC.2
MFCLGEVVHQTESYLLLPGTLSLIGSRGFVTVVVGCGGLRVAGARPDSSAPTTDCESGCTVRTRGYRICLNAPVTISSDIQEMLGCVRTSSMKSASPQELMSCFSAFGPSMARMSMP